MTVRVGHDWWWKGLVALAALLYVTFAAWIPLVSPPPLAYRNLPFPVVPDAARPGEVLTVLVDRCNNEPDTITFAFTRELVRLDDGQRIPVAQGQAQVEPGCHTLENRVNVVPLGTRPGTYILQGTVTVQGRWRRVDLPWQTQPFRVVEAAS